MMALPQLVLGHVLAAAVGALAFALRALTWRGVLAATLVGGLTYGLGGSAPAVLLIAFFATSSALSRLGWVRKAESARHFAKGGRRDHAQVLANGGVATVLAVLYGLTGKEIWLMGLSGALAAATADTWATELGVLARASPRLITTGVPVEAGTSGGVTLLGSLAAACGAALIGLLLAVLQRDWWALLMLTFAGVAGAGLDSLLGASVQAMYWCPHCARQTERTPQHTCGKQTAYARGWRWLNNDVVNFIATVVGAIVAMSLWSLL